MYERRFVCTLRRGHVNRPTQRDRGGIDREQRRKPYQRPRSAIQRSRVALLRRENVPEAGLVVGRQPPEKLRGRAHVSAVQELCLGELVLIAGDLTYDPSLGRARQHRGADRRDEHPPKRVKAPL